MENLFWGSAIDSHINYDTSNYYTCYSKNKFRLQTATVAAKVTFASRMCFSILHPVLKIYESFSADSPTMDVYMGTQQILLKIQVSGPFHYILDFQTSSPCCFLDIKTSTMLFLERS